MPIIMSTVKLLNYNSRMFSKQYETNSIKSKVFFSEFSKDECNKAREILFTKISTSKKHRKTNDHREVLSNIHMLLSIYYVLFRNRHVFPLKTVLFEITISRLKLFPQNHICPENVLTFYQ